MPIESATFISELNPANPDGSDARSTLDNHQRLTKQVLQNQFPSLGAAAVTRSAAQLNAVGLTQAPGDNSANPASTAFVTAAISAVNAQTGLVYSSSASASIALTSGQRVRGTNAGVITYTAPASPAVGDTIGIWPVNGRLDNIVAWNGNKHKNVSDATMTLDVLDLPTVWLWTGATFGWDRVL